eukprot:Rmarinus@m.10264
MSYEVHKEYEVTLGDTFLGQHESTYHCAVWNFRPASIDTSRNGRLVVTGSNSQDDMKAVAEYHNKTEGSSSISFSGSYKPRLPPNDLDAVLVFDGSGFRLEKTCSLIALRTQSSSSSQMKLLGDSAVTRRVNNKRMSPPSADRSSVGPGKKQRISKAPKVGLAAVKPSPARRSSSNTRPTSTPTPSRHSASATARSSNPDSKHLSTIARSSITSTTTATPSTASVTSVSAPGSPFEDGLFSQPQSQSQGFTISSQSSGQGHSSKAQESSSDDSLSDSSLDSDDD